MKNQLQIGVGVVGTGFIGELHIESLRRLGFVKVVAIAEVNKELASLKASQLRVPKFYSDFHDLVSDNEVEVVHVCTPNYLHYKQTLFTLEVGKHVVCEKPLGLDSNETFKLVELLRKSNVVGAVNFNSRFYPLVKVMKDMVQSGELGDIYAVTGSYMQDWMLKKTDYDWRSDMKLGGKTQVVATIGSHWLDLVQYVIGFKIDSVCADFQTVHKKRIRRIESTEGDNREEFVTIYSEDFANILLRFSNDIPGNVTFSHVSAGKRLELKIGIYGSKCSVEWNSEKPNFLWIGLRDEPNRILLKDPNLVKPKLRSFYSLPGGHTEGYADTIKQNFENIYYKIINESGVEKTLDFATIEDGHDVQLIIDSIFESAKNKKWIKINRNNL